MNDLAKMKCDVAATPEGVRVVVTLLGPFTIGLGQKWAGPWPRPPAKRLCELLMLRPRHRLFRDVARELLFANLTPEASANALRKAVSMARQALLPLAPGWPCLLRADREHICVPGHIALEIDLVAHEAALHSALAMEPGDVRDVALCAALLQDGVLLEDEPYSDWALEPRVALERLRQRARMELARNRTQGYGRSRLEGVIDAWENCLAHDPASEEAAVTLMRAYAGLGQRQLVARTYHRCRRGLEEVGLKASVATERAYHDAMTDAAEFTAPWSYEIFAAARNAISSNPVTSMKKPALEDISLGLLTHS